MISTLERKIVAIQQVNNEVWFHYQSPRSDSTYPQMGVMVVTCNSPEDSLVVARQLGEQLGLSPDSYPND